MRWRGVVLVLAGLGLAAILVVVVGVRWFTQPGAQVAAGTVVGPEARAVVRVGDLAEHPGAVAAFDRFLEMVERIEATAEPGTLAEPLELLARLERRYRHLPFGERRDWLPREAVVVLETDLETGAAGIVAAVNFRGHTRPLEGLVAREAARFGPGARAPGPGPSTVYVGPGGYLAWLGGTVVAAGDRERLERALERMASPGEAIGRPAGLDPGEGPGIRGRTLAGARLPAGWADRAGDLLPSAPSLEAWMERAAAEGLLPEGVERADFRVQVGNLDRVMLTWWTRPQSGVDAEELAAAAGEWLGGLEEELQAAALAPAWRVATRHGATGAKLEVRGVEALVERLLVGD